MALWNDIQKGLNTAASYTVQKTSELTDTAKSKYNVYNLQGKLDKCYASIGKLYYDAQKNSADHAFEIQTLMMQVEKLEADISALKSDPAKNKDAVICESCGAEIAKECAFCSSCGAKSEQ